MELILYAIPVFLLLILVEFSFGLLCDNLSWQAEKKTRTRRQLMT